MNRSSGVLLPIFSLPSNYGIGDMGANAYKFVDLLSKSYQKYWQVLPLNPLEESNSPYYSISSYAGNPLFISPDDLYEQGLISKSDISEIIVKDFHINYIEVKEYKSSLLKIAFENFNKDRKNIKDLERFIFRDEYNIYEYAVFKSIKEKTSGLPFTDWDDDLKLHKNEAVLKFENENRELINYYVFEQYLFFEMWNKLKSYAENKGIKIIGDAPIYSSPDSADVWAYYQNFNLDENRIPIQVAGCPPDAYSPDGQLWGNPVYDFENLRKTNYEYMISKFSHLAKLYDCIRIDHFRGYESYYSIDISKEDARSGTWNKSFGEEFFNILKSKFKSTEFIAEDLGFITTEVIDLLHKVDFPGMKVFQFAINHKSGNSEDYLPHNYPKNSVAYLGTHDNDTFCGWFDKLDEIDEKFTKDYLRSNPYVDINIAALKVLYNSNSNLVISNPQDILGIGSIGRINTPGTVGNKNWSYIFNEEDLFSDKLCEELSKLTIGTKRK